MFAQNFKYLKFYNYWFCKLVNYKEAPIINQAKQNHVFASGGEPPGACDAPPINRIEVATA